MEILDFFFFFVQDVQSAYTTSCTGTNAKAHNCFTSRANVKFSE